MTRLKSGQDIATGLIFVLVGVLGLWIGWDYPRGSALRPGTGVFPAILSWCLVASGSLVWLKALLTDGPKLDQWAWRPIIMITLATVAFALLIDRAGLVVTMVVTMTLAALGTHETRWREFVVFTVIMLAIGLGLFIWGLGMPVKVFPWN